METIIVEIHAAEGGADAKLLVEEQLGIYKRYCTRRDL
jgi:protein subunit release factor A